MQTRIAQQSGSVVLGIAVVLGVVIAAVDNVAIEGEVSPIVIVGMLLVATAIVGMLGARRAWLAALAVWVWVPLAHVVKHVLGMHDTLHPNTYVSIMMLGVFTLVVALVGTALGVLARRLITGHGDVSPKSA